MKEVAWERGCGKNGKKMRGGDKMKALCHGFGIGRDATQVSA